MDHSKSIMPVSRINALSDGVFAVAMTLLVVNLSIPENIRLTDTQLHVVLMNQAQKFSNYVISFLLTAVFWITHHRQHHYIKRTDTIHLWINIFILMFVVLVPFSTSLVGDYGGSTTAEVFFAGNMMMIAVLFRANWLYATKKGRLIEPDADQEKIQDGMQRSSLFIAVCFLAFILSLLIPRWSSLTYLLFPIGVYLRRFKR
ncbi:MAG: DUF1211 domain-containing protein [Deltaproteobacteria bacterium]